MRKDAPEFRHLSTVEAPTLGAEAGTRRLRRVDGAASRQFRLHMVDDIVEVGELDPEVIITPHIFVRRIVKIPPDGLGSASHRARMWRKVFQGGYKSDLEKVVEIE